MIRVLLVEDDNLIAKIITHYLTEAREYEVTRAKDAGEALYLARNPFDVILLDIVLPDADGLSVCERLRERHDCPIIFISCMDDSDTIVRALELGGDDYLTKPFDNKVLVARIQANLRRHQKAASLPSENRLAARDFVLDPDTRRVKRGEASYPLASIEYQLLLFLMQHPRQYFSADELYRRIWGKDSYGDVRTVLVHVHNIRQKIEANPREPGYLLSRPGHGYYFNPDGTGTDDFSC